MARSNPITVQQAIHELDDKRVKAVRPLIPPQILSEELPLDLRGAQTVLVRTTPFLNLPASLGAPRGQRSWVSQAVVALAARAWKCRADLAPLPSLPSLVLLRQPRTDAEEPRTLSEEMMTVFSSLSGESHLFIACGLSSSGHKRMSRAAMAVVPALELDGKKRPQRTHARALG